MVLTFPAPHVPTAIAHAVKHAPVILTLGLLIAVMAAIAWSYVAQPRQPDGVCYASRGHPVPCKMLKTP